MVLFADKKYALFCNHLPHCPCTGSAEGTTQIPFLYRFISHFLFFRVPPSTFDNPAGREFAYTHKSPPMFPDRLFEGMAPLRADPARRNWQQNLVVQNPQE